MYGIVDNSALSVLQSCSQCKSRVWRRAGQVLHKKTPEVFHRFTTTLTKHIMNNIQASWSSLHQAAMLLLLARRRNGWEVQKESLDFKSWPGGWQIWVLKGLHKNDQFDSRVPKAPKTPGFRIFPTSTLPRRRQRRICRLWKGTKPKNWEVPATGLLWVTLGDGWWDKFVTFAQSWANSQYWCLGTEDGASWCCPFLGAFSWCSCCRWGDGYTPTVATVSVKARCFELFLAGLWC